ncbi:hypothetical protein LG296_19940 (plasmid) [Ureibacillus chungkukjangi]|uniref:hypothetical protein n=1 Tax=Ureibacillus chungkukjangi TaxID=1202712 RepID=UPI000D3C9254|nr:hypothetical protein [Ureibacillus chungkukjangi]MCM3390645.1 hypothetical protein [Ureibacillus chungkukjangi]
MEKKRFKFVVPVIVIVAITANYMIYKEYNSIPILHKVLIISGATFFSGVISYFLFPSDDEKSRADSGPY